jgi:hypothetical protein
LSEDKWNSGEEERLLLGVAVEESECDSCSATVGDVIGVSMIALIDKVVVERGVCLGTGIRMGSDLKFFLYVDESFEAIAGPVE